MGWLGKLFGLDSTNSMGQRPTGASPYPLLRIDHQSGSYPVEAVGESNYQDALEAVCGGYTRDGHEMICRAVLQPEPDNPYDGKAHMVMIANRHVAYLSRAQAARMSTETARAGHAGAAVEVTAIIRGGWRTNQHDQGHFGVRLAFPARGALQFSR